MPEGVSDKLLVLYRGLPSLRSLEFDSGKTVVVAPKAETVIFRPAEWNAVAYIRNFLTMRKHSTVTLALKRIDAHWRVDNLRPISWPGMENLAKDAGIRVVVMWRGEIARVYA
jgi:hypothetical protein